MNERHRQLQFDVATFARKAGYGVIVEKKISFHNEGKRADLIIQRGSAKQDLVIDITVGLPTCDAHVGVASKTPNATIAKKEKEKNTKYFDNCAKDNLEFKPLAFEAFGAWSPTFVNFFKDTLNKMGAHGQYRNSQVNYWTKRISCTIMKFNSRCIMSKINCIGYNKSFGDEAFRDDIVESYGISDV